MYHKVKVRENSFCKTVNNKAYNRQQNKKKQHRFWLNWNDMKTL